LPPPVVSAGCSSINYIKQHPELRSRLLKNATYIRNEIIRMNFSSTFDKTPIVPIFFNSEENAQKLSNYLKENNIIVPFVKYPVKSDKFIVRITTSANHTDDQIDQLLKTINEWREKHGVN